MESGVSAAVYHHTTKPKGLAQLSPISVSFLVFKSHSFSSWSSLGSREEEEGSGQGQGGPIPKP